jgi:pSer/pThr/pTyr-binding forkhead associated (FHA) protein
MDRSRSRRQVLILDCCHSGAFAQGSKAMTGESAGTGPAFEGIGYGRVVLTATDATQYAWEGDKVIGQADRSVFTHYLIEGLRTGEADTDLDGTITLDEMYDYVYEKVVTVTPRQTPGKWSYKQQGDIVIARNPHPSAKPAVPSSEVFDTARHLAAVKSARLIVQQGVNPGAIYPLRAETNTIGRSDGLEVTIRDTVISRRQARITLRDGEYFIEDLLSANGTFVNGRRLEELQTLKNGDQITIDIASRGLHLHVSDDEIRDRLAAWQRPAPKFQKGYLALYSRLAESADKGAIIRHVLFT